MSTTLKHTNPCPNCGRGLPAGVLSGLCPACLLAQGLGTEPAGAAPPPRFEPPSVAEIARLFPQLEILSLLGAGGMGAVYKARQPVLDRLVALKILPAQGQGDTPFAERFNREARALARLSHPNIVAVHEFGQVAGLHYFLMEFVDGANLRQLERAGRLAPREALQLVPQICDALQYAHDEGVVHRDIKPENVLVDRKGRVKIADFGLAKIMGQNPDHHRLTLEGQVMGTPHYMAPEQFERPLSVDHRADIYALGVVLYEMLTGDLPLGNFPPPSRKVTVDVRFDEVVLRALENDPARRYQHASEVKSRMETIAGTPAPAAVPAASDPVPRRACWGGFPLVVEHEGGRRVDRKEAFRAWAIGFGLLTLGFALVTALTGRTLMGWLGISGGLSLLVRIALAAVWTAWGVRQALRRPWELPLPRTPQGAVILPPAPWWRSGRMALAGIALVALTWTVFQELPGLLDGKKPGATDLNRPHVAVRDPGTGALVATLPNGGSVELLALAEPEAAPNQWWRPDGSRLTNTALAVRGPADMTAPGTQKKELAFRVNGLPRDADSVIYEFDPIASVSVGGEVRQDGKVVTGGWPMRVAWPASAVTATVRLGYILDPWRTIATQNPGTYAFARTNQAGDPAWTAGFNHFSDDGTNTYLTVVLGPVTKDWRMRVIALGQDGVEHLHQRAAGTPAETSTTWTLTFDGLTKSQVQEFQVQVRPVHWVEFRDVVLRPHGVAPKPAALAFGPVQELTFDGFLDFDTGKTGKLPQGNDKTFNPFKVTAELLAWMQQNGFDACAGAAKLETLGVTIVNLAGTDWDALNPEALTQRLREQGRFPTELRLGEPAEQPANFGFRTREGGTGLLQFVSDGERGATVRIKRVERPGMSPTNDVSVQEVRVEADGTGQFPTVQAALDAAAPGTVIRLGPGRFAESLRLTKPVSLIGASWTQTIIGPREPARPAVDGSLPPVVQISGSGEVVLSGIKFTQPGLPPEGRLLPGAVLDIAGTKAVIRECAVLGGPGNGIVASAGAEVRVERCLIAAVWNTGIRVTAPARLTVTESDLRNCHYAGIRIGPGVTAFINRCRISGAAWHGVRYDDASPEITDNFIFANARSGIYASGTTQAAVRGNVFFENEMDGISCWFNNTDQIVSNTFSANQREGLSVLGSSSPLIASNIFHRHLVALRQGLIGGQSAAATHLGHPVIRGNVFWENRTNWQGAAVNAAPELVPDTPGQSVEPQFRDAARGDFTLGAASPARAAGAGAAEPLTSMSPFPVQPEELAIIPAGASRDSRLWKRVSQP